MPNQVYLRNGLYLSGVLAVFLAVAPFYHYRIGGTVDPEVWAYVLENPDDVPYSGERTFGWYDSPLVHYQFTRTATHANGVITVSRSGGTAVYLLSWSGLTLACGVALLWLGRRLTPSERVGPSPLSTSADSGVTDR